MTTDQELLREYSRDQSETAFAELVRRHVDFVFSAALRMVRDSHLAEDVTQNVFVALAQNARAMADRPVLSGWLHRTARNLAVKVVRSDVRRRAREQEAIAMNDLVSPVPEARWEHLAPHLDAALGELEEADRDALLLRYFERKSAREMAETLGVSDEAAQKRVNRAVDRLRKSLFERGVAVGASALLGLVSAHAVQAAPAGLAAAICAGATGALKIGTAATVTKTIAMTALQKTIVAATIAVLVGGGAYEAHLAARLRGQVAAIEQQQAPRADEVRQLRRERDEATNQLAAIRAENTRLTNNAAELLRLRGMAGVTRRAVEEAGQLRTRLAQQSSPESPGNPITGVVANASKQLMELRIESQLSRLTASLHLTPEQEAAAHDILMRQAQVMLAGMQQGLSGRFDKEEIMRLGKEAGNPDMQIRALLTPDQLALYPAYKQEEAEHNASEAANTELAQMQPNLNLTPDQVDRVYAVLYGLTLDQLTGRVTQKFASPGEQMQWALEQKVNAVAPILTATQLASYRRQEAIQAKAMKDAMDRMESAMGAK